MTLLYNDRYTFVDDAVEGFAAAHSELVRQVDGGIVIGTPTAEPRVAVVLAGSAGHYPANAGLVGPGLASGAAIGDVFAPPPLQHIVSVARAADQGRGTLLCYPHTPGRDTVYQQAGQTLADTGNACRTVAVTDDIGTPNAPHPGQRRGGLGSFAIAKIAGAAAAEGLDLDDVAAAALKANARTVSLSVFLAGCTLPGEELPLLSIRPGRMALGPGQHGEPGTEERDIPTADGLAELLIAELLGGTADHLTADGRVAVVLSGLGATTHEELFIVYRRINQLLTGAGIAPIQPVVGEIHTSLNAAGTSCALLWLDDELFTRWVAPANTAAFRRR